MFGQSVPEFYSENSSYLHDFGFYTRIKLLDAYLVSWKNDREFFKQRPFKLPYMFQNCCIKELLL